MTSTHRKFVFRPLVIVAGALATGLTITLGILQIGSWINENAVWSLWATIVLLVVTIVLLIARLAAVTEVANVAAEAATTEAERVEAATHAAEQARDALRDLESAVLGAPPTALSEIDRSLAEQLFRYASDPELLSTLGSFFPYQIPQGPVRLIDELSELPATRTVHDAQLEQHLSILSETAQQWRTKFLQVASTDGDHYSTRLSHVVSQDAYTQHAAMTDELGDAGFELHSKLLAYQKYYASL